MKNLISEDVIRYCRDRLISKNYYTRYQFSMKKLKYKQNFLKFYPNYKTFYKSY